MRLLKPHKAEQQNELLLNLIFPDYPDGDGGENENSVKEKEVDISTSNSDVNARCAYTSLVVDQEYHTSHLKSRPFRGFLRQYSVIYRPES